MNMNRKFEEKSSAVLSVLGNPFRVRLVIALAQQEACVCHLETLLKKHQAYISQHLMALRKAGLVNTRRDGKYIYYRMSNPAVVKLILQAALLAGISPDELPDMHKKGPLEKCACPHCSEKQGPVENDLEEVNVA